MRARYATEHDRLLERVCELLGAPAQVQGNDDALLIEANLLVNQALQLCPTSVDGWLLKCQVASASHDDIAALAAIEMALRRAPHRPDALYWRGAILGDLGRPRDALRSIEAALTVLGSDAHWLLEDLYYEKAVLLEALGLHDRAVAACSAGLARCPGSALLRSALGPAQRARVKSSLKVLRGGVS
jgi:tetratricopeptide (TPR) repeat protein